MKEHPILFSTDMVRAILDRSKTMTRRVIVPKPSHVYLSYSGRYHLDGVMAKNQKQVGDRLWVRETWATYACYNRYKPSLLQRVFEVNDASEPRIFYKAKEEYPHQFIWRPSIFMPRWASRITLEITEVRVERLQEISESDALAEGITIMSGTRQKIKYNPETQHAVLVGEPQPYTAKYHFEALWDSLNAKRGYGWEVNPWVWVIEFKRN